MNFQLLYYLLFIVYKTHCHNDNVYSFLKYNLLSDKQAVAV